MRIRATFITAMLVLVLPGTTHATTLVRLSLEQLSQASSAIVRGRVVSQESRLSANGKQVVTLTTIAVEQSMKGRPSATLVVEQPGGAVGNRRVRVAGTIQFRPETRYMLFLEPSTSGEGRFRMVGMLQGAYRILRDERTQGERVIRPLGSVFYGSGRRGATPAALSTGEFHRQLSAAISAPITVPRGTAMPVSIIATASRGAGRLRVEARTSVDIFPSATVVIPAGSVVEGTAQRSGTNWQIHWTTLNIRDQQVGIDAESEEPAGASLRGRVLVVKVR